VKVTFYGPSELKVVSRFRHTRVLYCSFRVQRADQLNLLIMPYFCVNTNVPRSSISASIAPDLSRLVSSITGKPESVSIRFESGGVTLIHDGTDGTDGTGRPTRVCLR